MTIDFSVILAWIMFLALLPLSGATLYRAWKIGIRADFRYVAPWNRATLPQPERWAPSFVAMNLVAGAIFAGLFVCVLAGLMPFKQWSGVAAITLWAYFGLQQLLARKARLAVASPAPTAG